MILLHKQIELARAKAVIKIFELADEYEEKTGDLFYRGYDKTENGINIVSNFETRQRYEYFCKNIDILLKQIDSLTSDSDKTIKKEKILDVIKNCRNLHISSYMKDFYYDGTRYQFETETPSSSECPVFTDAALTMMNEWECQLTGKNHPIIATEGYLFNLEEFFRHLIPDKKPSDFHLDTHELGNELSSIKQATPDSSASDSDEYDPEDEPPLLEHNFKSPYSRIFGIDRKILKRLSLLFMGVLLGALCLIGFIMLNESQEDEHSLISDEQRQTHQSLIDRKIQTSVPVENLNYEIYKLRQQVYTLQQASAKHDNYLQEIGMEEDIYSDKREGEGDSPYSYENLR